MGLVIGGHTTGENRVKNIDLYAHTPQLGTGNVTEYERICSKQNDKIMSEHTPVLRAQADLDISPVIDCVHLRTDVQPASPATDFFLLTSLNLNKLFVSSGFSCFSNAYIA